VAITLVFSTVYIIPSFYAHRPSSVAVLDLVMRSAVTKCAVLVALLVVARLYGVRPSKTVAGLALGLALYLAVNTANFALAESYGRELYGSIFSTIGPLNQTLCVLIWTVALWRPEPDFEPAREFAAARAPSELVQDRLGKFNAALARLLRK